MNQGRVGRIIPKTALILAKSGVFAIFVPKMEQSRRAKCQKKEPC
jgi:hypothetical protein